MRDIIGRNRTDTDIVIHLGDCTRDFDEVRRDFPTIAFLGVRGNNDFIPNDDYPHNRTFTYDGHTYLLTHGHMEGVRSSQYSHLVLAAKKHKADVVLFGHTHVGVIREYDGIHLFNPGSLTRPRDFCGGSYGVIRAENGKINFEIIKL